MEIKSPCKLNQTTCNRPPSFVCPFASSSQACYPAGSSYLASLNCNLAPPEYNGCAVPSTMRVITYYRGLAQSYTVCSMDRDVTNTTWIAWSPPPKGATLIRLATPSSNIACVEVTW